MPKFLSIFFSPSSNTNYMIKSFFARFVFKNSFCILIELFCQSNFAWDRSSMIYLIHHCNFASLFLSNDTILVDCVYFSIFLHCTSGWRTIFAFYLGWASKSIFMASGLIRGACLISNIILIYPFVSQRRISSRASSVCHITGK